MNVFVKNSKKTRILVDSISLLSQSTGIGRYTYEISKQIKNNKNFKTYFYYGYHSDKLLEQSNKQKVLGAVSSLVKNYYIKKILRKFFVFLNKLYSPTYDIYWQPNFIPTESIKMKHLITTVHDFSFILYKEFHPKERIEFFENNFFKNIYKSDIIIAVSKFSKKEILDRLEFPESKVKVIYNGVNHDVFKIYDDMSLPFGLPKKFIFSVGSIEPRKNLRGLLAAYNSLDEKYKKEYNLVLAGFKGWQNNEIMEIINNNKEYIHYLGYISDIELAKTYNLASLFIYPSFYEGFGLPPLEAMACGTPVITSNVSSLPEVCGDAAIYCDPYNTNDIKEKIQLVLEDETLKKHLSKSGLKQASKYNWKKSAKEHLKIFKEVLSEE